MEIEDQSPDSSLYTQLNHFLSSGQWQRAKEVLETLLSTQPESAWLHHRMGITLYNLGDYKGSEVHYKKTIATQPDFADAYNGLAHLYLAMGRTGTAEDNIRKALSLDPEDEDNWIIFGHLSLHFQDPHKAIECANKALELDPDNLGARDILTRARAELGDHQKITPHQQIQEYQQILELAPENDLAHSRIGSVYFNELKDYESAEQHFRSAIKLDPDDKDNQKLLVLALRKRDPILRFLWSPLTPALWILSLLEWAWDNKWPLIFVIFITKYLVVLGVSIALIFFTIFWPLAKIYEYLTISDLHQKMGKITFYEGPFAGIHRLKFKTRFFLFVLIMALFWTTIFMLFSHEITKNKIVTIGGIVIIIGVIIVYGYSWFSFFKNLLTNHFRKRKNKKLDTSLNSKEH